LYIGWCNVTESDGTKHDKVWTAFKVGRNYYAGWGKRGKRLSFKHHPDQYSLSTVTRSKKKKYEEVDAFRLFAIFPYFKDEVEKSLTFAVLSNKIK
jgi:hypothetical protein